jgi:Rhs element Vgr protein
MSVVTPTILSNGKPMDKSFELLSIDIIKEINRIPYAVLVLIDGSAAKQKFTISNDAFFEPGNRVDIKLRYENAPDKELTVFSGLIVKHGVQANERGSMLTVELKDAALKLHRSRNSKIYKDKTDDKIIAELIANSGLKKGPMAATQTVHTEMVQYSCTDWDFIAARAEACGLLVIADDGAIALNKIEISGSPKHHFEFGISEMFDFEIEVDANHQYADIECIAWDLKTQQLTKASKAKSFGLTQGNLKVDRVAQTLGASSQTLSSPIPTDPKALQAWADGSMAKSRMALIRGYVAVPGLGDIKRMDVMEIAGVGNRFNGKTLVTGVHHRVDPQGWRTNVQFGLSPERFATQKDVTDVPAAGLLPGIHGLQIGVVATYEEDPAKEFRVGIRLPGLGEAAQPIWARLATPDAGKERGFFFRPEAGDEVVVGFFNNDPGQPVILGEMYGSKNTPPKSLAALSEKNIHKGIVSKKGTTISFVDEDKSAVFIETPAKNKILLDDSAETITLTDQHGNYIKMSKDGIEIKSIKDFKINAANHIDIQGTLVDIK